MQAMRSMSWFGLKLWDFHPDTCVLTCRALCLSPIAITGGAAAAAAAAAADAVVAAGVTWGTVLCAALVSCALCAATARANEFAALAAADLPLPLSSMLGASGVPYMDRTYKITCEAWTLADDVSEIQYAFLIDHIHIRTELWSSGLKVNCGAAS